MPAVPSTTPVMWSLTSGSCTLLDDGCLTTVNFPDYGDGSSCEVSVDPGWTGVLFVEYMEALPWHTFYVDGEPVPADYGQQSGVHGMAPRSSLVWSPRGSWGTWKLCQVTALPPWRVTRGDCHIDREGCFVTADVIYDDCFQDFCIVEFPDDWAGSLNVSEAKFEYTDSEDYYGNAFAMLTVNGQIHALTSSEDLLLSGVHGMVATGFTWQKTGLNLCTSVKICPMESLRLPGPWGDDPWTCTARGETASCRSSSTVSLSAHARSSFRTRTTPTKTEACTTGTRSVSRRPGFLGAVPAVARQEKSRPTTCLASSLTRKLLGLSLAGLVQLDDSRVLAAVALQTIANCVHLEHHRLQVQLRARTACLACSMITKFLSVPLASLDSLVLVLE